LLSSAYRGDSGSRAARTPVQVAAYLAYRVPATFAAAAAVFRQIALQRPEWRPVSLLDAGAGPGVAAWAAAEIWPSLTESTLVETEPEMLAAGRELLPGASWVAGDVSQARGPADLVVASYVLGELHDPAGAAAHLWQQTEDTLALIEPGTPAGYRRILAARTAAIGSGGQTVGPCPHDLACPLEPDDWCHFAVRLPRSRLHRQAKGAELGYEDEKFSYAVLSRASLLQADARIIRQPRIRSGHVNLVTCERDGIHDRTVSRKQGARYREAKGAAWGDAIADPSAPQP
jgi:ribosomal protein RSM22 (predicted rRNA methylase)